MDLNVEKIAYLLVFAIVVLGVTLVIRQFLKRFLYKSWKQVLEKDASLDASRVEKLAKSGTNISIMNRVSPVPVVIAILVLAAVLIASLLLNNI